MSKKSGQKSPKSRKTGQSQGKPLMQGAGSEHPAPDLAEQTQLITPEMNISQENFYRNLVNNIPEVVWLYSLEKQTYLFISPSVEKLRGYSVAEAMEQGFHHSLHEEDYTFVANHLSARIQRYQAGDPSLKTLTNELRQTHKNGSLVWVEITTTLIKNSEDKVIEILGVSRDITHRKKESDLLKDTQNFFETVFNFTGTGIALISEKGTIININEGFCRMLGFPKEYILGKNFVDFLVKGDESCVMEIFDAARTEKSLEKQSEIRMMNVQGQMLWGIFTVSGVKSTKDQQTHWVIQIQETTARKKAEEIIQLLNTDLQLKNKEMEQLVYVTSHDLRSPLVNIRGFSRELEFSYQEIMLELRNIIQQYADESRFTKFEKDIAESFEYINISINKMDKLLSGLLHYSRLGKKRKPAALVKMNVLVSDVIKNFEYTIKSEKISVSINPLPNCMASEEMVHQALSNLMGNAIKYLDRSRPGAISISGREEDGYAIYIIEDNGIGIQPKYKDKIFELFCRVAPEKTDGEGLGLATVKKILELNAGKIKVESIFGEGTKFKMYLPRIKKAEKSK